jgi:hypothetical protein
MASSVPDDTTGYGLVQAIPAVQEDEILAPPSLFATEGTPLAGQPVATFFDANQPTLATINWGDGTSSTSTDFTQVGSTDSGFYYTVRASHTYGEERTGLPISVTVTDDSGSFVAGSQQAGTVSVDYGQSSANNTTVAIQNTTDTDFTNVTLTGVGTDGSVNGQSATFTFPTVSAGSTMSFSFPASAGVFAQNFAGTVGSGSAQYIFQATWGGQTVYSVFSPNFNSSGNFVGFLGNDVFKNPTQQTVPLTQVGVIGTGLANVLETPVTPVKPVFAQEYQVPEGADTGNTYLGSFSDPGTDGNVADYHVAIDWKDGSALDLTSGSVIVSGTTIGVCGHHVYQQEEGVQFTPTVTLYDQGGSSASLLSLTSFAVTDGALTLTAQTPQLVEGATGTAVVAILTDVAPSATADDYTIQINWGDGSALDTPTSVALIAANGTGSSFAIKGTHKYAEEGSYKVHVTVVDVGGSTAATSPDSTAVVADALLRDHTSKAAYQGTEAVPTGKHLLGKFSDGDPKGTLTDYSAIIHWGDGTTSLVTSLQNNIQDNGDGTFSVYGNHTYTEDGAYAVQVEIDDNLGPTFGHSFVLTDPTKVTITVAESKVTVNELQPRLGALQGIATGNVVVATFTDPAAPTEGAAGYSATIFWGDGSNDKGTILVSGGTISVVDHHTYKAGGQKNVHVLLRDDRFVAADTTNKLTVAYDVTSLTHVQRSGLVHNAKDGLYHGEIGDHQHFYQVGNLGVFPDLAGGPDEGHRTGVCVYHDWRQGLHAADRPHGGGRPGYQYPQDARGQTATGQDARVVGGFLQRERTVQCQPELRDQNVFRPV